jgi:hypothetical protein
VYTCKPANMTTLQSPATLKLPARFEAVHVRQVQQLLRAASEPDPPGVTGWRKAADQMVQQCLFVPGFMAVCQSIFSNDTLDENTRFLATICARNTVQRVWTQQPRRAPMRMRFGSGGGGGGGSRGDGTAALNAAAAAEPTPPPPHVVQADQTAFKASILHTTLPERSELLARHQSLLISVAVRAEIVRLSTVARGGAGAGTGGGDAARSPLAASTLPFWPELLPTVVQGLRSPNATVVVNSIRIINDAVREMSSMTIQVHKAVFRAQATLLMPPILAVLQHWASAAVKVVTAVLHLGSTASVAEVTKRLADTRDVLRLSLLAAKTLRRCVVRGCVVDIYPCAGCAGCIVSVCVCVSSAPSEKDGGIPFLTTTLCELALPNDELHGDQVSELRSCQCNCLVALLQHCVVGLLVCSRLHTHTARSRWRRLPPTPSLPSLGRS